MLTVFQEKNISSHQNELVLGDPFTFLIHPTVHSEIKWGGGGLIHQTPIKR